MKTEPTEAERAATVPETVALLGLHQLMASDCLDIIDDAVKQASERMEHQTPNELWKACCILCEALAELRELLCECEAAEPTEGAIDGIHGIKITLRARSRDTVGCRCRQH